MSICRPILESALGKRLSDQEFSQIEAEFKQAAIDAGKAFGKNFSALPKADKARLISDKLNQNRASALTSIETQLIRDKQIVDLSGELKTTGGQKLEDISATELADNVNNLVGNTNTRQAFIQRNGSAVTFDTAIEVIKNKLSRIFNTRADYLEDLLGAYSAGKTVLSKGAEDALMDKILSTNYYDDMFNAINKERASVGLPPIKNKLDLTVSRDDMVNLFLNNGRNIDQAAKAFSTAVAPLLKNTVDLELLYKDIYSKRNSLDVSGKPTITLNQLEFKDGAAYMSFVRTFGAEKNLFSHVNSTLDNNARQIAAKRVWGNEDVVTTLEYKIELERTKSNPDKKAIDKLKDALEAYKEVTGLTGREYDTSLLDLSINFIKNWTGVLFLGRAAIKGKATDTLITNIALASRGDVGAALSYNVNAHLNILKSGDADDFYVGLNEYLAGTQHYMNVGGEGVMTKGLSGLIQKANRTAKNLTGAVQAIQAQNIFIRANKRALGKIAESKMFNSKEYPTMISESISVLTHSTINKLGAKSLKDISALDVNTYNNKMGLNLTDAEFQVAKSDLEFEIEAAIMHQIQALQIDSGGISVQAQNARLGGNLNSGTRRYGFKILGQFQAYSQNFLLKSPIIRHIAMSRTLFGKSMYGALALATFLLAGYSNYNVNEALKSGSEDPEYADPYNDIESIFDGDKEAIKRFVQNVVGGTSLPLAGLATNVIGGGASNRTAPAISYTAALGKALFYVTLDPTDGEKQAALVKATLPFNLPGLWDGLLVIRQAIGEEN